MQTPELVAHRGFAGAFPENSLVAVRAALELGVRWLEIDVQLTADEHVVLFHDRTLDRLCGTAGSIHDLPLDKVRELTLCESEETIVELREVVQLLESYPNAKLFVEVKRIAIEQHGAALALAKVLSELAPIAGRVILISFSLELLKLAEGKLPLGLILDSWKQAASPELAELAPEFVFCNHTKFPAQGDLTLPARLVTYEVVDPKLARALAARGVELVETFQLADMLEALQ